MAHVGILGRRDGEELRRGLVLPGCMRYGIAGRLLSEAGHGAITGKSGCRGREKGCIERVEEELVCDLEDDVHGCCGGEARPSVVSGFRYPRNAIRGGREWTGARNAGRFRSCRTIEKRTDAQSKAEKRIRIVQGQEVTERAEAGTVLRGACNNGTQAAYRP